MSVGQQFLLRFAIAAVLTALIAYGVTAFIVYDADTAHWSTSDRAGAAVSWLTLGGLFSVCAGVSAVKN